MKIMKEFKVGHESEDYEMMLMFIGVGLTTYGLFTVLNILSYGLHPFIVFGISLALAFITSPLWYIFVPEVYIATYIFVATLWLHDKV